MSDRQQLELIREAFLYRPDAEEEAKRLLLKEIYEEVARSYTGYASNGAKLSPLPDCVARREPCADDMAFTYNAIRVLMARYISRDQFGRMVETPSMVLRRVALGFRGRVDPERLYGLIIKRRFMFNSPTLFNMYADGAYGALSACYVTPVYDSMEGILDALRVQALTFKYGGGQGFSFSSLRPRWAVVRGTGSFSSGPISFMRMFDTATESVKQGGKRRGANMGIMHDWHPDIYNPHFDPSKAFAQLVPPPARRVLQGIIEELKREGYKVREDVERLVQQGWETPEDAGFIQAKRWPLGDAFLTNFNISVGVHDAFMKAVVEDKEWWMVSPQLSEVTTGDGDYNIHYSVSSATGLGIIGDYLDRIRTPFFSILEDEIEKAKKKGTNILAKLGMTPDQKNPYMWKYPARKIWSEIVRGAWETGDPGLIFLDNHNKWSPTPWLGVVVATNPCVSGNTLVLTPSGLKTARDLYNHAKINSTGYWRVLADPSVLGDGGSTYGYDTIIVAPTQVCRGLGMTAASAIVWHVGRKPGVKVTLSTGHEVTVTPEHRLLVMRNGRQVYVEARELLEGDRVPIYLMPAVRDQLSPPQLRMAKMIGALLASEFHVDGDIIRVKPFNEKARGIVADAFHYFIVAESKDEIVVVEREIANLARHGVERLVANVPLGILAHAGYRAALALDGARLTDELKRRLPVLAVVLQLAGWVMTVEDNTIRTRRLRETPVFYAEVVSVEKVDNEDFYDFTVPGFHAYIANGLVHHNCGEQPLYPYESCNLGSMSVEKYVEGGRFKVEDFARDVEFAVDALDAVIDLNRHPDERQSNANKFTRKIGLGIMGLADLLARLGYPYDSEEAVATTLILMAALEVYSWKRSWELGARLGHAPAFGCRAYDWRRQECLEPADPEELVEMHTPALVKASMVARVENGWLTVKYHDVTIPDEFIKRLRGEARNRVLPDGRVRLVRADAVDRVARDVFGVTREMAEEAASMPAEEVARSPRHLLALAIWRPGVAWEKLREYGRSLGVQAPRNTVTTTVAPTGSISILAGTSSGIEPYFALVFERHVTVGTFLEVVREFRDRLLELARRHGLTRVQLEAIYNEISRSKGSLRWSLPKLRGRVPDEAYRELEELARLFPTAMDFGLWYHLAHNAAAQLYVDQAISKTVNLPKDATTNDIETVFFVGWLLGLKGVTVYRDESKATQVIRFGSSQSSGARLIWREQGGGNGGRRRIHRMALVKRTARGLLNDPTAVKLFNVKTTSDGDRVVVELDENSTCKTCHL